MQQQSNSSTTKISEFLTALFIGFSALIVSQVISMIYCLAGIAQEKAIKEGGSSSVSMKNGRLEIVSSNGVESISYYDLLLSGSGMALGAITGILLIFIVVRVWKGKHSFEFLGLLKPQKSHWALALVLLVFCLTVGYLLSLFFKPEKDFTQEIVKNSDNYLLLLLQIGVLVPFLEELIFRGLIFGGLERISKSNIFPILLTTALFTISHAQYGFAELLHVAIFGLALGYLRGKSGSIWPALSIHIFINSMAIIIAILGSNNL